MLMLHLLLILLQFYLLMVLLKLLKYSFGILQSHLEIVLHNVPSLFRRGFGILPPPTSDTDDIVWCGALNGLVVINGVPFASIPAILCIFVISRASSKLKSGRIDGILLASIVLP